jgi:Nicotinate phosphoribosyltransferase C-terminal domain
VPGSLPPLSEIWEFAQTNLRKLPDDYHHLLNPKPYPVRLSKRLQAMRERAMAEYRRDGTALGNAGSVSGGSRAERSGSLVAEGAPQPTRHVAVPTGGSRAERSGPVVAEGANQPAPTQDS